MSSPEWRRLPRAIWRVVAAASMVLVLCSIPGHSNAAGDDAISYRFGAGDRLRITVLDHPELSGEFMIHQSGSMSLPSVGRIGAAGRGLEEFEEAVAARLRDSGLVEPQISVDVAAYRPVFVVGDVKSPGKYPFEMGMTVLQAIAVAGGLLTLDDETLRLRFELLRAREEIDTIELGYLAALAKRARLLAERDDRAEIHFPTEIIDRRADPMVARMIDGEARLFATRAAALKGAVAILENQKSNLHEEVSFLEAQLRAIERRDELVETELRDVEYLFGKGLAAKARLLELQRLQTDVQRDRLGLAAFMARSRQEISEVDLSIVNLRNDRLDRILGDLATVEQEISELGIRRKTGKEVVALHEMTFMQPALMLAAGGDSFVITRDRGDGPEEMKATDRSYVLPGDVVRVVRFELRRSRTALADRVPEVVSLQPTEPAVAASP